MRHAHLPLISLLCPMVLASRPYARAELKAELEVEKVAEDTKAAASVKPKKSSQHTKVMASIKPKESLHPSQALTSVEPKDSVHDSQAVHASRLKRNGSPHLSFNSSEFHSTSPAFPFLLPGQASPMEAKTKNHFNRMCFRFIYAVTVNLTKNDDPAFFYDLFYNQCVGADKKTCSTWSDELLTAIRKKMQAVKLLGKDGRIGRSKKLTKDEEFEAHLPPTLTGITSYANWCNELYGDLRGDKKEEPSTHTHATTPTEADKKAEPTNAIKTPVDAVAKDAAEEHASSPTNAIKTPVVAVAKNAAKEHASSEMEGFEHASSLYRELKKTGNITLRLPSTSSPGPKAQPQHSKPHDGCVCVHRNGKQTCHCDKAESSETAPLKRVATQMKGLDIAEQASEAASNGNETGLDDVEAMMHKARSAAETSESRSNKQKVNLKKH